MLNCLDVGLNLKESLQVVDLEERVSSNDNNLEETPPLDSGISRFGGISVDSFTDDNVSLFVLNTLDIISKLSDLIFKRARLDIFSTHVNDTVNVESNILSTRRTELVGKAVFVSSSNLDISRDITIGN